MNIKKLAGICIMMCLSVYGLKAEAVTEHLTTGPSAVVVQEQEDFSTFLEKFTTSASFQYERIQFPLATPIVLLDEDGETEHTFPFTREKWALLDAEMCISERVELEEGGVFIAGFLEDEPDHKVFQAGYEESEVIFRVVFDRVEGQWFLTDGYFFWFAYNTTPFGLEETILSIGEDNIEFEAAFP